MDRDKMKHDLLLRTIKTILVIGVVACFYLCWYYYYRFAIVSTYGYKGNITITLVYLVIYLYFSKVYDSLQISMARIGEIIYNQILAIAVSDGVIYVIICLLAKRLPFIVPGLACFFLQIWLAAIWGILGNKVYFRMFPARKTIIIYDTRDGMDRLIEQYGLEKKFNICKIIDVSECLQDLSVMDEMDVAFLSGIHSHERNIILKHCVAQDIRVFVIPRIGDVIMSGAERIHMFHLPMLQVERYRPTLEFLLIKRTVDIILSLLVLIITSPIQIITAIIIKLTDCGPVFYRQDRLTKNGKVFKIIKFRSMRVDAEKDGVARLSSGDKDPRITPIGRFIRKVRIDELPQLFNILKGDMSIIGPRPERPEIAAQYEQTIPEFALRLQAKAGLTGYAQIYGKYNTTPYDKLQMDLMYIANPSILEEIRIAFATIRVLFLPESTEGVEVGQTTAMWQEKNAQKKNE